MKFHKIKMWINIFTVYNKYMYNCICINVYTYIISLIKVYPVKHDLCKRKESILSLTFKRIEKNVLKIFFE